MIHRTYIVQLFENGGDELLPVDIIVALPGSRLAPVLDPTVFPNVPYTAAPADWITACGTNWYYELRGRALRLETRSGATGFVPRTNLGYHISVTALQAEAAQGTGVNIPGVALSASLVPTPVAYAALDATYATPFADPSYGPVIRVWPVLVGERPTGSQMLYQVDFRIQENKDEDFTALGHA